ncbi:hypothetical protein CARUB_v10019320mg [Capsella rubella]|uniref:Prolamin-like domain-containing protein n=1 Tax=Capsella rubella TaxID=81985 RepID=R0FSV1_9BRAS|nr:uncharacterized protein LOC17885488 [Capsella rubella]EOA25932.1 hypothetical protein CARUB_v10019320mg [Capsella rubella]
MQRALAMIAIALIIMLSIFIQTQGEDDLAPAPAPSPKSELPCLHDVKAVPDCVKAVFHFRFKEVTKTCCDILLTLPDDCFLYLFPIPYIYHGLLNTACKHAS